MQEKLIKIMREKTTHGSSYCKFLKSARFIIAVLINYTKLVQNYELLGANVIYALLLQISVHYEFNFSCSVRGISF